LAESSSDNTVMPHYSSTRARFYNELPDDRARAADNTVMPHYSWGGPPATGLEFCSPFPAVIRSVFR
jgi:hypothetical protein